MLIDEWKSAWKYASVQVYVLIGAMPDIYNGVAAMGWMDELPSPAMWVIRGLAAAGIAARILRQKPVVKDLQ